HLPVPGGLDGLSVGGLVEAGPARARVELGVGREQLGAAPRAAVDAVVMDIPQLAREGVLGTGLAQHAVLLGGQLLAPLLVGLADLLCLGGHGPSFSSLWTVQQRPTRCWSRPDQNVAPMADPELTLRAANTEATFLPGLGMVGVSLRQDGQDVLALPGGLDAYRAGHVVGLPLLAPWANRLGGWHYEIAGVAVALPDLDLHDDGAGLPIPGTMVAQTGWKIARSTDSTLEARFDYGARPDLLRAFPFPHELVLDIEVADRRLRVATTIRPTADRRVPVSFGWHPYLALPASREETLLRMPACEHRLLDSRGLPTGAGEPQPAEARPLGDRAFDDLYALGDDRRLALEGGGRTVT